MGAYFLSNSSEFNKNGGWKISFAQFECKSGARIWERVKLSALLYFIRITG